MPNYVVRYGAMRFLGVFSAQGNAAYRRGTRVIARTDRGLEDGEVLCEGLESAIACLKDPSEGQILREMTAEDGRELERIRQQAGRELETCQQYVARLGLPMQLADLEHIFGGERIVVYYLAENRVDFRELVRLLAGEFQTRIEMRQIGVRDEAKRICGLGICGRKQCCSAFLNEFEQITTQMAKDQQLALNPVKISGNCGRLLCCLRYEDDLYIELFKNFPEIGSTIRFDGKRGTLNVINIFTEKGLLRFEDGTQEWLTPEEIRKGTIEHAS